MNQKIVNSLFVISLLFWGACTSSPPKNAETTSVENAYSEKYRPQFHFSPDSAWMNDPNGMVYYDGEYHLFYQYYPDSTVWGPMHWGHAISTDLVHWEHLPIALYPDQKGYIFSGSAVVDWNNTSGFGTTEKPPMIAIFTYHDPAIAKAEGIDVESQAIAYSLDKGRTWTKYEGNPVIPNDGNRDFRDPKVFWNDEIQRWNLVLSAHDHVQIYSSENLKSWTYESEFGADAGAHEGVWECPDLFPLQVKNTDEVKWLLIVNINPGGPNGGSGTQYFLGDFDGHQFTADSKETSWVDWGRDNYAGVTWADVPQNDGRRIFLGWMSNWNYAQLVPTEKWRSAMTIPRSLMLIQKEGNYILKSNPVKEMALIEKNDRTVRIKGGELTGYKELEVDGVNLNQCRIKLNLDFGEDQPESWGLILENELGERVQLSYSIVGKEFQFDRTKSGDMSFSDRFSGVAKAPYLSDSHVTLDLFVDAASAEFFVNDGELVMTEIFFNSQPYTKISLFANEQPIKSFDVQLTELESIWSEHN